jgi:homoserine/homoserine lactone efflux protein
MPLPDWLAFLAAAFAISLSPGPGALAAMSSGLQHGFSRGYFTTLGLILGIWTQALWVGVGVGALLATSALAFTAAQWLGAAYLAWLGVQQWRQADAPWAEPPSGAPGHAFVSPTPRRELVRRGWMVNAINPKGTVFMLAVLPQFIRPDAALAPQYLVAVATLSFTDLVVMAGYTGLAARVLRLLRHPRQRLWMNRSFGALFVLAGLGLLAFQHPVGAR